MYTWEHSHTNTYIHSHAHVHKHTQWARYQKQMDKPFQNCQNWNIKKPHQNKWSTSSRPVTLKSGPKREINTKVYETKTKTNRLSYHQTMMCHLIMQHGQNKWHAIHLVRTISEHNYGQQRCKSSPHEFLKSSFWNCSNINILVMTHYITLVRYCFWHCNWVLVVLVT